MLKDGQRDVVVALRNSSKAGDIFAAKGSSSRQVKIIEGVDFCDLSHVDKDALFNGVDQIVSCLGPSFSAINGSTSEDVDYKATVNLIHMFKKYRAAGEPIATVDKEQTLVDFSTRKRNISRWSRLDDVLMGGSSSSSWKEVSWGGEGETFCRWSGNLVVEGGGFCGTVIRSFPFNADGFDGISLLVRGDGNRYKVRVPYSTASC